MQAPNLALVIAALVAGESLVSPAGELAEREAVVSLPATASYAYTLTGRIRPLLFWISRDHVGLARITWRASGDVRGYELLVGSDPDRAPRHLNRWGYIAETVSPAAGSVFALMTRTDEDGEYDAAASAAARSAGEFRAMRSRLDDGVVAWETSQVPSAQPLTVFDLDSAVAAVRAASVSAPIRRRQVGDGVRPGFLSAVAALLDRAATSTGGRAPATPVTYVFGPRTYELSATSRETVTEVVRGARVRAVRLGLDIRAAGSDQHTQFQVTAALEGPYAGVPVRVAWQPKWWLGLELRLVDADGRSEMTPDQSGMPLR
jgi:hypothetical protein